MQTIATTGPLAPPAGTLEDILLMLMRQGFPVQISPSDEAAQQNIDAMAVLERLGWPVVKTTELLMHEREETSVYGLAEEVNIDRLQRRWGCRAVNGVRTFKVSIGGIFQAGTQAEDEAYRVYLDAIDSVLGGSADETPW